MIFKSILSRTQKLNPVRTVYEAIVAQARQADLYSELAVPDTLDGRFDMIILHNDAVMCHMQAGEESDKAFAQALIDEVFRDMDRSLREMGVGDMGVGKRVKKMASVYYGRANAYANARAEGEASVAAALVRNVFEGTESRTQAAERLAKYTILMHDAVGAMDRAEIRAGNLNLDGLRP
ncbi:ubiquinol-cytochrome C chaperone family protein [Anderseniella sp. Alg231-50]|uniref:ubiquinol-cytochrome C chaperone family protein n=1 Tax=Anderseniella sp. Alg231-50 TaxID=1922226 RepID=UPI000D5502CC